MLIMMAAYVFQNGSYFDSTSDAVMSTALILAAIAFLALFAIHVYAKALALWRDEEIRQVLNKVFGRFVRIPARPQTPASTQEAFEDSGDIELTSNPLSASTPTA